LIHNLIHRDRREIREHYLRDGPQTGDRGPNGGTYDRRFGNRGIANPFLPELRCQTLRNLKHTSGLANIYPHQYDSRIPLEFFSKCASDRFTIG
jgi:hypothetical protein